MLFVCKIIVPFPLSIGQILGNFFTINYIYFLTLSIRNVRGLSKARVPGEKNYGPLQNTPFELHFSPTFLGPPPPRPKICTKHTKSYGLP
jgi:hypothetical protein